MHWRLAHSDDTHSIARYGIAPTIGVWAQVCVAGATVWYCVGCAEFDAERPVVGLLTFLAEFGFFGSDDIADAMTWLLGHRDPGLRRPPRRLRRVLRVIERLKSDGG